MVNIGSNHPGHVSGTAAAQPGSYRNILLPRNAERNRKPLHRSPQPRFPEQCAIPHIHGFKTAVQISDESDIAGRRQDRRQERSPLLDRPLLLHRLHIVSSELSDVAASLRHLEKTAVPAPAAGTLLELDLAARHVHATLAQRYDELL